MGLERHFSQLARLQDDPVLLEGAEAMTENMRIAARTFLEFSVRPILRERHRLHGLDRTVLNVCHNADADGFGVEIGQRKAYAAVRIAAQSFGVTLQDEVDFSFERVMRFYDDPTHNFSIPSIAARNDATNRFLLMGDIGAGKLSELSKYFDQGVILDHHSPRGTLGSGLIHINPHLYGFSGDDITGSGLMHWFFDEVVNQLLSNNPFKLNKYQKKLLREFRTDNLLWALGGSAADRVGNQGLNEALYRQAQGSRLLRTIKVGGYGHSTKTPGKMLAETVPFNVRYPHIRLKTFRRALDYVLNGPKVQSRKRKQQRGLSPAMLDRSRAFYSNWNYVVMLEYNDSSIGPKSGLNLKNLFVNMQNVQFLSDEEIAAFNEEANELGLGERCLERVVTTNENGRYDRVVVCEDAKIEQSEFHHYSEDLTRDMERRVEILDRNFPVMVGELLAEMRNVEGRRLHTPHFDHLVKTRGPKKVRRGKPEYKRPARGIEWTRDEVYVIRRLIIENISSYADPFRREMMLDDLLGSTYATGQPATVSPLLHISTVGEIGTRMTALSKLRQRDPLIQAINWGGGYNQTAEAEVEQIHMIYRRMIAEGMSHLEGILDQISEQVMPGVYVVDMGRVSSVRDDFLVRFRRQKDKQGIKIVEQMDERAMVGVFLGLAAESRIFPEHYVLAFGYVQDEDYKLAGQDGIKISGRISTYGVDRFQIHLGEHMEEFMGGGHPSAASARILREQLPDFIGLLRHRPLGQDYEESQLLLRVPDEHKPQPLHKGDKLHG